VISLHLTTVIALQVEYTGQVTWFVTTWQDKESCRDYQTLGHKEDNKMKKLLVLCLFVSVLLVFNSQVWAEQSSQTANGRVYVDNQVFTMAYNNSGSEIQSNNVVILDTTGTAGSTLGAYITTSTTADDYRVFGVTDETIATGAVGRVVIRGPHEVLDADSTHAAAAILACSTTAGVTTTYSTSDGTTGGYLGHVVGASSDLGPNYAWVWINPQIHD